MSHLKAVVGFVGAAGLLAPSLLEAAPCSAQARFVKASPGDAKGFKQAVTLAVSASGVSHGLVTYTLSYTDKGGATQTKSANVSYKYAGGTGSGGASGGIRVTDETVLVAGACAEGRPCSLVTAVVGEVSCFKDAGGRCTASATYVDSAGKDPKGFKQAVNFNLSSADCGAACHGLVKYTAKWRDKDGVEHADQKNVSYKMSAGGASNEVEIVDDTVLGATQCSDSSPCQVLGATIDKVSCFADR